MKHTPGPWTLEDRMKTAVNAGTKHIAMVNFYKSGNADTDVSGDEHTANCHLIAAAPELLATLEMLVKVIEEWPSTHKDGDYLHGYPLNAARAAIAKATAKGK